MRNFTTYLGEIELIADAISGRKVMDEPVDHIQVRAGNKPANRFAPFGPSEEIVISSNPQDGSKPGQECEVTYRKFTSSGYHRRQTVIFNRDLELVSMVIGGIAPNPDGKSYELYKGDGLNADATTLILGEMVERLYEELPGHYNQTAETT